MAIKITTDEGIVIEFDTVEEFTEFQRVSDEVDGEDTIGCEDEVGDEDKPKFKVGDKVRVVSADDGTTTKFHHVPIGEVVTITYVGGTFVAVDYNGQALLNKHIEKVDEDTTPKIEVGDKVRIVNDVEDAGYYHSYNVGDIGMVTKIDLDMTPTPYNVKVPGRNSQYLAAKDIEKVESVGKDANGDDLYIGDLVTGIEDNGYLWTTDEALMKVVGEDGDLITVEVVGLYEGGRVVGKTFPVNSAKFVKTTEEAFKSKRPQFDDGDVVIVTQPITDSDGDEADAGTVGIIIDNVPGPTGSCLLKTGQGLVRVYGRRSGDDHLHKLTLVCKAEDRADRYEVF